MPGPYRGDGNMGSIGSVALVVKSSKGEDDYRTPDWRKKSKSFAIL